MGIGEGVIGGGWYGIWIGAISNAAILCDIIAINYDYIAAIY